MFFPRLRRRAKWVFVLLAVAFGLGFVAFGVGTGVQGASLGDVLNDVFGGGSSGPSIDDAQEKLAKNPQDADAQLELAQAYLGENRRQEAIAAYTRYTELRPKDVSALQQLAGLYQAQGDEASARAQAAQANAQTLFGAPLAASDSPLARPFDSNPVATAVQDSANGVITAASQEARQAYAQEASVYEKLTLLEPDSALLYVQLGNAATQGGDYASGLAAYSRFLELAPEDALAPQVRSSLLYLAYQAEQSAQTTTAIAAYQEFLKVAPKNDKTRTAVEKRIDVLKQTGQGSG